MPDPVPSPSPSPPASPPPAAPPVVDSSPPTPPSPAPTPPTTPTPPASTRPAYVPDSFWDATSGKVKETEFAAHFNELQARIAAEDVRKATLPQSPDAYKVELPKDFTPPPGVEFKFNDADPLLSQARGVMHDIDTGKLSGQEAFSKLLGLYAGAQVSSQETIAAARNAEIAKLGATGPARVDAVTRWAKSVLTDAEGAQLASRMFTASDVQIFEKLITRMTNQGGASFKGNGREPPEQSGRLSADVVSKMSLQDQLAYARQFKQSPGGKAA